MNNLKNKAQLEKLVKTGYMLFKGTDNLEGEGNYFGATKFLTIKGDQCLDIMLKFDLEHETPYVVFFIKDNADETHYGNSEVYYLKGSVSIQRANGMLSSVMTSFNCADVKTDDTYFEYMGFIANVNQ